MLIAGVLDLRGGQAVHASGGRRSGYLPVVRVAGAAPFPPGDAAALAEVYADRFELDALYMADLDAIDGGTPNDALVATLCRIGLPVWLDAGVSTAAGARAARDTGAAQIIVGLETLPSFDALAAIAASLGAKRTMFSLDLRHGRLVTAANARTPDDPVPVVARRAREAGAEAILMVDLGRVGGVRGVDWPTVATVRRAVPDVPLLAGGGIRDAGNLEEAARQALDGVVLASALHDGRIGPEAVRQARERSTHRSVSR